MPEDCKPVAPGPFPGQPSPPGDILKYEQATITEVITLLKRMNGIDNLPRSFEIASEAFYAIDWIMATAMKNLNRTEASLWPQIADIANTWSAKVELCRLVISEVLTYANKTEDEDKWEVAVGGYRATLARLGNEHRVEQLAIAVLDGFLKLAPFNAFAASTDAQVSKFRNLITRLSEIEMSDKTTDPVARDFTQHIGSASQGFQNNSFGPRQRAAFGAAQYNIEGGSNNFITSSTDAIVEEARRTKRNDLLKSLQTSPYVERKDRNPQIVSGTCEWFKQHEKFKQWYTTDKSSLIWVSADPGAGKSVLTKHLVDNFLRDEADTVVTYFFFKEDFVDQQTATSALSCILHQLFTTNKSLLSEDIMARFEKGAGHTQGSVADLWSIFLMAMSQTHKEGGRPLKVICVLDALDECLIEQQSQLVETLVEFFRADIACDNTKFHLKILVTSRPYRNNWFYYKSMTEVLAGNVIHLAGDSDQETYKIASEIHIVIKARVDALKTRYSLTADESASLMNAIAHVPNRTYLWAKLMLDQIDQEFRDKTPFAYVVNNLPKSVDDAYEKILSKSPDYALTRKLLHIVVAAAEPLTLLELDIAMSIKTDTKSFSDIQIQVDNRREEYIRHLSGLFITVVDSKVYLLHQTAKEFLVPSDETRSCGTATTENQYSRPVWKSSLVPCVSHRILLNSIIWFLSLDDFHEISKPTYDFLVRPRKPAVETKQSFIFHVESYSYNVKYVFFRYSIVYLHNHIVILQAEDGAIDYLLSGNNVASTRSVRWFDVLLRYWESGPARGFTNLAILSYLGLYNAVELELKKRSTDVNAVDWYFGRSPLSWATSRGNNDIVRLLLQKQNSLKAAISRKKVVNVDQTDHCGNTALHHGVTVLLFPTLRLLIRSGANPERRNNDGDTPKDFMKRLHPRFLPELQRVLAERPIRRYRPL